MSAVDALVTTLRPRTELEVRGLNQFLIELTAGLIATLVGIWVGRRTDPGPTLDNSAGVIQGDVSIDQSRRSSREFNLHVHETTPAADPSPPKAGADGQDLVLLLGGAAVLMLALALGYVLVRDPALLVFGAASTFLILSCVVAVGRALLRRRLHRLLVVGLAMAAVTAAVTFINRRWLGQPEFPSDRLEFFFDSGVSVGFNSMLDYLTWDDVTVLAFQGLGLLLTGLLLLLTTWSCFMVLTALRRGANSISRPGPFIAAPIAAVLSMLLCSGWAYDNTANRSYFGDDRADELKLDASAKLSPNDPQVSLLCARLTRGGVPSAEGRVSLEGKVRIEQGRRRWQSLGAPVELSPNGTHCREVAFNAKQGPFRFSLVIVGGPIRSGVVSVESTVPKALREIRTPAP